MRALIRLFAGPEKRRGCPPLGTLGNYHLRPLRTFMELAPLKSGAEPLEEHGHNARDEGKAIHTCLHWI